MIFSHCACLFGVAPDGGCRVSPPGVLTPEDSSLWPSSSRRRARALPCIPLCGARTFLCACAQRLPGRLPLQFYRRRQQPMKPATAPGGESCADASTSFSPTSRARAALRTTCCSRASRIATCTFSPGAAPILAELHEAGYLIKTDFVHGAGVGLGLGALGGATARRRARVLIRSRARTPQPGRRSSSRMLVGGLIGTWVASMVGASVPNSKLSQFQREIEPGKILLMVDVPLDARRRHPRRRHRRGIRRRWRPDRCGPIPVFP